MTVLCLRPAVEGEGEREEEGEGREREREEEGEGRERERERERRRGGDGRRNRESVWEKEVECDERDKFSCERGNPKFLPSKNFPA